MKKIILFSIILCISALKAYSQCTDCHDGRNLSHLASGYKGNVTPNGNGTLGVSFDSTLCGLNYIQAIQNTQTRYTATKGTGFPTHDTVRGLPVGCYTIIKAYLYFQASCPSAPASYSVVDTITNPANVKSVYSPIVVGTGVSVCWGENATALFRADITPAISGNGAYRINLSGFAGDNKWIDGVSMVIIYQDNTASYTGTFVLADGEQACQGGTETDSIAVTPCGNSTFATAFTDLADLQNNAEANFMITENGTTSPVPGFPTLFFQTCPLSTTVPSTETKSITTLTVPGDCYGMFMYGLYTQTACLTCAPATPLTYTTQQTPAPCGLDSGTAKIIVTSDTAGVTYSWTTGSTADSIYGLAPGHYCVVVKSPGACYIDTVCFNIVAGTSVSANIVASKDSVCPGTADTLTLTGSGGATYKWAPGGSTNSVIHVNLLTTTTYTLYTFNAGCKDSANVTIKLIPKITDTLTQDHDTVCPFKPVKLTATSAGGQSTYKWSTGATTSSITVSDSVTTTYTATVYGICDSLKKNIKVTVIPLPKPVIKVLMHCKGQRDTLTVSGGTTYLWSNGLTTTKYITGPINADSTITLVAFNSLGCSDTLKVPLTIKTPPTIKINPPAVACKGTQVLLTSQILSGTGPFSYVWTPGGATTDTVSVFDTAQTTYVLRVSNGCVATATTTVKPDAPILSACCSTTISKGDDTTLTATGDTSIVSYTWTPAGTCLNPPLCNSISVSPTVTTTYTVVGTDYLGCQTESIVTIIVETPCFNFTVPNVITPTNAGALGLNNVLYIKTTGLSSWSILIVDRWGKEMFKSTNPTEYWTGTSEGGGNAPDGVYYYIINATCQGNNYKKDGFIQLIR